MTNEKASVMVKETILQVLSKPHVTQSRRFFSPEDLTGALDGLGFRHEYPKLYHEVYKAIGELVAEGAIESDKEEWSDGGRLRLRVAPAPRKARGVPPALTSEQPGRKWWQFWRMPE